MNLIKYGPWALIVGGSEGVGEEFALKLAADGLNIALVARKTGPLDALAARLETKFGIRTRTLSMDMSGRDAPAGVIKAFGDLDIGLLIYNAGAGNVMGSFVDRPAEAAALIAELNVMGPTALAHHYGSAMVKRGKGAIMFVGSGAGEAGTDKLAVYSAAKSYLRVLAEALWYELKPKGVDVTTLVLGVTRTPQLARIGFPVDDPNVMASDSRDVALAGLAHIEDGPVHYAAEAADLAKMLRPLERAEAVRQINAYAEKAVPTPDIA